MGTPVRPPSNFGARIPAESCGESDLPLRQGEPYWMTTRQAPRLPAAAASSAARSRKPLFFGPATRFHPCREPPHSAQRAHESNPVRQFRAGSPPTIIDESDARAARPPETQPPLAVREDSAELELALLVRIDEMAGESCSPESAACGSPLRRAYRPDGAVAEWLKAAVC